MVVINKFEWLHFVYFSGKCRVYEDHHQSTAVKVHVTAGPFLKQADADLKEQRRSEGAED